jgi:hypothetical protein
MAATSPPSLPRLSSVVGVWATAGAIGATTVVVISAADTCAFVTRVLCACAARARRRSER